MKDGPDVSIVMGSSSDLEIMQQAAGVLAEFGVTHELRVISAHRTPDKAHDFARSARQRGTKVVIAAAGKAAHLAGVLASLTTLPVIGVPLANGGDLGGLDALLSTVQMPGGVPVAATAIGAAGAKNAALLAVEILALADKTLVGKLETYRQKMQQAVEKADRELTGD